MSEEKVKGPASYFPSIIKKYGQPIEFWFSQLDLVPTLKHMEQVEYLQTEHQIGQGNANAVVHVWRSKNLG